MRQVVLFHRGTVVLVALTLGLTGSLDAQAPRPIADRIRSMAMSGDSAGARRLADSAATSALEGSNVQAEATYWRALLTPSPRERRLGLTRVAVEFSTTPVAADALYQLAQMDVAAGDRAGAQRQLARAVQAYAGGTTGGDAAFEFAQFLMSDGKMREGCAALDSALVRTPTEQVEKRNRMSYTRRPCDQLAPEAVPDSTGAARGRGMPDTAKTPAPARGSVSSRAWSAQVGAFASKTEAEKVVTRLSARGYEARVTPEKPFRVRIGRFATRAEAAALVTKLKSEKTNAILVEAERP